MNVTNKLQSLLDDIKVLECKLTKDKATSESYKTLMISMADLYILRQVGSDDVGKHLDAALYDVEKSLHVFERHDYYEDDLRGIHLDMAKVNIRAAIYYSHKLNEI